MATTSAHPAVATRSTDVSSETSRFLRNVLRGNTAFSLISGTLVLLESGAVAAFMGINSQQYLGFLSGTTFLTVLSIGVILFGLFVGWVSMQQSLKTAFAREILVLDIAWVVLSAILLLTNALDLSTAGSWAVLIVADIATVFAALEFYGLRRLQR